MKTIDEIIKEYEQLINPNNNEVEKLVNDAIPAVIDGFVDFYGEECREEIIEKFNRIKIVFPPLDMYKCFNYILNSQINDYLKEKYPDEYTPFNIGNLKYSDLRLGKSQEYINELDEIEKKIAPFQQLYDQYSNLEMLLSKKANEELKDELNTFVKKILFEELGYTETMLDSNEYDIGGQDILQNFQSFAAGTFYNINNPGDLCTRILTLRNLGIEFKRLDCEKKNFWEWSEEDFTNAKDEFSKLINDPSIKKFIPSREVAMKILNKNQTLTLEKQERVAIGLANQFYGIKDYFSNYKGIEHIAAISTYNAGGFNPALMKNDGKTEVGGILMLNKFSLKKDELGRVLIHEGNHGFETTVIDNGETYTFISGWDIATVRNSINHKQVIEYDPEAKDYRPFELLNECINDFITNEIRENVKRRTNNITFSSTEDNLYANAYFVVEEFYQLYKPEIIESRKNHNMDALYQKIGYENFQALAQLMRIVSSKLYSGNFDYKTAIQNLENGIANEETEFLVYVIQQRDKILANMKEYSQASHMSRGNITINSIILLLMYAFILLYIIITIIK